MEEIKTALDSIEVNPEIKKKVLNNILKNVENFDESKSAKVHKIDFKRYIPVLAAACFTFIIGAVTIFNSSNTKTMLNNSRIAPVAEVSEENYIFYSPNENGFKEYALYNCPQDPMFVWTELTTTGFYPKEIKLLSVLLEEKCVSITFSENLDDYNLLESVQKSFEQMYPDLDVVILY